jgi:catechol 2,3-dioxygenase
MAENGTIDPRTSIGAVRLGVSDIEGVAGFYRDAIGLQPLDSADGLVRLGAGDGPVIELSDEPDAPPRPAGTSGLFHLAILVPSRIELARALHRVAAAGARLSGASDHLVSEALYLSDPDGNGIEIYRDRPREEWPRRDGQIQMDTLPLDLDGVLGELRAEQDGGPAAEGTRVGHVHLNVGDLAAAEQFYSGTLGFEVTVRGYPGALFVSAGGYHHHVGLNTWAGQGAPPPPPGSRGLRWFEIRLPEPGELDELERRLDRAGVEHERDEHGIRTADPSGNSVLLSAAERLARTSLPA